MIRLHFLLFYLFLLFSTTFVFAQQKVEGIVFDKDTKQRVGKVWINNLSTQQSIFNNARGEFELQASVGDILVSSRDNYFSDTLRYNGEEVLIIYMKRAAIHIDPVTVVARKSPDEILNGRKRDYSKAYGLADPGSYISVGDNGAGLSINAVYNYFSREGRNARRLTQYFQREYEDNFVDIRFSKELVRSTTGLEGEALDNFMIRYRPEYEFVFRADHYQMVKYIKSKYEFFKFIPYIKPLPNLNEINLSPKEK